MASDRTRPPTRVVLDANLLYPFQLRNLLVQFGVDSVIEPRWTMRIHEEWMGHLVGAGRVPRERLLRTLALMNGALPDAEVRDWEAAMPNLQLPDPNDRHVLAAALAAEAGTILTMNLRDFPDSILSKYGVAAIHPDVFLCTLFDAAPELLRSSTEAAFLNLSRTTPSLADYIDSLHRQGLPQFAARLRRNPPGVQLRRTAQPAAPQETLMDAMPPAMTHDARLDRLAEVAVRVGLGLAPGQEVVLTAPLEAVPLVRRITEHAYKAGASMVTTLLSDEAATLARFQHAPDDAFDHAPAWLYEGMAAAYRNGAARLAIAGENPALLAGQDVGRVARANRARSVAYRPALELITNFAINWTIACYATPSWAQLMFPDAPEHEAVGRLWDAIFAASRVDTPDPVAAWATHNTALHARTALLNAKRYAALRFTGPGTALEVGLSDGHLWAGGAEPAKNGIVCNPNIPSEEVFTTPHRARVDGHVRSTKPLSYQGTLIRDIAVVFEAGRIVQATASTGQDVLEKVLGTDEGARRLGEVALVPHSSPISASGLLFFNTLLDENAASHIALGQAYRTCLEGGTTASDAELEQRGANSSLIHIDWMIGSGEIDVDGVAPDGTSEAVMRGGEWV